MYCIQEPIFSFSIILLVMLIISLAWAANNYLDQSLTSLNLLFSTFFQILASATAWFIYSIYVFPWFSIEKNDNGVLIIRLKYWFNEKKHVLNISDIGAVVLRGKNAFTFEEEDDKDSPNTTKHSNNELLFMDKIFGDEFSKHVCRSNALMFLRKHFDVNTLTKNDVLAVINFEYLQEMTKLVFGLHYLLHEHDIPFYTSKDLRTRPDHYCGEGINRKTATTSRVELQEASEMASLYSLIENKELLEEDATSNMESSHELENVFGENYSISKKEQERIILSEKQGIKQIECISTTRTLLLVIMAISLILAAASYGAIILIAKFIPSWFKLKFWLDIVIVPIFIFGVITLGVFLEILLNYRLIYSLNRHVFDNDTIKLELTNEKGTVLKWLLINKGLFRSIRLIEDPRTISITLFGGDNLLFYLNNNASFKEGIDALQQLLFQKSS